MSPAKSSARRRWWMLGAALLSAAALSAVALRDRDVGTEESLDAIQRAASERRWPEVEARLGRWLSAHPDDGDARVMLGLLLRARKRDADADSVLRRVEVGHPAFARARAMSGEIALDARRAAEAERAFRAAAGRDPRDVEPRRRLVYLLSLQQRNGEARDVLWELYRITRDPRHLIDLVLELWAVESDVRGLGPELEAFLARTPDDPFLRRAWGLSLLLKGRPADALPHLEAAAEALGDDPVGRFALAECRMMLGRFDGDESILGPRPDPPADASRWWVLRSRLDESRGRDDQAIEALRAAIAANPENVEAHHRIGQALSRRGDPDGAKQHLDRSEALRSREVALRREHEQLRREGFDPDAETFERLGQLCREAGLIAEARAWFEQVIQLEPTRRGAQSALAQLSKAGDSLPLPLSRPRLIASPERRSVSRVETKMTGPGVRFEDVAERVGIAYRYESGAKGDMFLADTMGGGVALIDFDDDGWLDVYFVNGCPLPYDPESPPGPNRLFRNRRDGTFEDVTGRAGVAGQGYGMGAAVGDYDDDGHDDLFLTGLDRTVLYRNRGDGTFEDATARAGVASTRWTTAAGFGDLDGDGDLDLVAVTYVAIDPKDFPQCLDHANKPIHCSPGYFPAQQDQLFRNNGDGTFTDVSREAGIEAPSGRGLGLAIADLDDDGKLDLFVANDASPNFLFRNLGGLRFEEVGLASGAACNGSGKATASMGVVADDLDGDGRIDLFHTNFLNEGSTLRRNLGGGMFLDTTTSANLDAPSRSKTGFGAAAFDADNDGRIDLFVANGHVDDQPWVNSPMAQSAQLFLGGDRGRFDLAGSEASPYLARAMVGRGAAAGDLDNDGRVDVVVVHRDAPAVVLRNLSRSGHWLGVRLRGTRASRTPIGARVTCRAGGRSTVRWMTSGTSYLSANDPRLWFGLGPSPKVEHLEVRWPSGAVQSWDDIPADRILDIEEGRDPEARP